MNLEEYQKVTQELTEHRRGISKGKRKDYTKSSSDVLANFKNQARDLGVTELQSLGVHMEKQMSAVLNYIKTNGQSESEPIKNRIADTINYLELMWGLINDLDENVEHEGEHVVKHEWVEKDGYAVKIPIVGYGDSRLKEKETGQSFGV